MVDVLRKREKEIAEFPEEVRGEIADAAARLNGTDAVDAFISPYAKHWARCTRAEGSASFWGISDYLCASLQARRLVSLRVSEKNRRDSAAEHRNCETKIERGSMKRMSESQRLAKMFSISQARGMEAVIKARLIAAVLKKVKHDGITHEELAKKTGIPRSAVTGILSGSLQRVTIDRILKIVEAVGLVADVRVRNAA